MKSLNYFERFHHIGIRWLARHFCSNAQDYVHFVERLLHKIFIVLKTRGKLEAISYCKMLRLSIYKSLCLKDFKKSSVHFREFQILKFLNNVKPDCFYPCIRLVLSVLYISRSLRMPPKPNYETIEKGPLIGYPSSFNSHVFEFWKHLGYNGNKQIPRSVWWRKFHLSTKSGPNGQALWSSVWDLLILPESLKSDIQNISGPKLVTRMNYLSKYSSIFKGFFPINDSGYVRRLTSIADKEGKTREVAILDYWSQTALRPLHQYLFNCLRKIPQDCTFSQGSFLEKLNTIDSNFYSVDLKAATDRFPIKSIEEVLKGRFNDIYVNSWRNVMVKYPFWSKQLNRFVTYSVGNPMGAYSSWNSFALSHHYVMFKACKETNIEFKTAPYVLLGDDLVIANDHLYKRYMEIMTTLGVEISINKTHVSKHSYEFAKRFIHNKIEVSPFPLGALWENRKSSEMMMSSLNQELRKGWECLKDAPELLSELWTLMKLPRRVISKRYDHLFISNTLVLGLNGKLNAVECLTLILDKYFPTINEHLKDYDDPENYLEILKSSVHGLFERSSDFVNKKGKGDLGLLAQNLVILITSVEDSSLDYSVLISSVPVLQVYGQVEELYLSTMKEADNLYTLLEGDWKLNLRSLTIPMTDEVFFTRNKDLIHRTSSMLGKELISQLKLYCVFNYITEDFSKFRSVKATT